MTVIIAIIAAAVFCASCVFCVLIFLQGRKGAEENAKKMRELGERIDYVGELVQRKTELLAQKLGEQAGQTVSVQDVPGSGSGEIEEIDDEIDLDNLFMELSETAEKKPEEPEEPEEPAPRRRHAGYNIGRSGKKYSAAELKQLIR